MHTSRTGTPHHTVPYRMAQLLSSWYSEYSRIYSLQMRPGRTINGSSKVPSAWHLIWERHAYPLAPGESRKLPLVEGPLTSGPPTSFPRSYPWLVASFKAPPFDSVPIHLLHPRLPPLCTSTSVRTAIVGLGLGRLENLSCASTISDKGLPSLLKRERGRECV